MIITSGINSLIGRRGQLLGGGAFTPSPYAVVGFKPKLVTAFADEKYRTNGTSTNFDGAITHTRASTATYVDASGTLQTAASGVPRVGHHIYDGSQWVNEGVLHESEARTNLFLHSDMDTGWTKIASDDDGTTFTKDYSKGPDGQQKIWRFNPNFVTDPGGAVRGFSFIERINSLAGDVITFSVFIKPVVATSIYPDGSGTTRDVYVSLRADKSDGVSFYNCNTLSWESIATGHTVTDEDFGDGLRRISISYTATADDAGNNHFLSFSNSTSVFFDPYPDGNEDIRFGYAQVEEGSTPSSYIPTAGSQVTRAADSMTIPAAKLPYPTPEVIGSELVTNGSFDTGDLTGWSLSDPANSTATVNASGQVEVTNTATEAYLDQIIPVEIGRTYVVNGDFIQKNGGGRIMLYDAVTTDSESVYFIAPSSLNDFIFVARTNQLVIRLGEPAAFGSLNIYDNFSVKEINPLFLSIAMEGRMTYADRGSGLESKQYEWVLSAVNFIRASISTLTSRTGQQELWQREEISGQNTVNSANNYYSPGINVSFSIASRHGSTFINGALDGTALTANTTPTALPDLSATDLDLGQDFMGTIRLFRMWDDDLGDSGIAESTS